MNLSGYIANLKQQLFSDRALAFLAGIFIATVIVPRFWEKQPEEQVVDKVETEMVSVMSSSTPLRLRIPELSLDVPFSEPLGVDAVGVIEVPETYDTVGWYKFGPTPGALGPAVVLGHVDSYKGPAVFFSLGQLDSGDDIYIDRADGSTAHFVVEALERHTQDEFPTEAVYQDIPYAGLRLITCTGRYDRGSERYSHNLIVFARLVEDEEVISGVVY